MAFQIKPREDTYFPKKKATKNKVYLDFVRQLPCCVTGVYGVEAAHVSFPQTKYGHYGRGQGTKASDRWALPLSPECHRTQHSMNEEKYWLSVSIDPHILCLVLHGLYVEMGDIATEHAHAIIMRGVVERLG